MKSTLFALLTLSLMPLAQAQTRPASRPARSDLRGLLWDVNQAAKDNFDLLSPEEERSAREGLEQALAAFQGRSSQPNLLCVVSETHPSYRRLTNGRNFIGSEFISDETCREFRNSARGGLVCSISPVHSRYYRIYRIQDGQSIGLDGTSPETCMRLIQKATRNYICAVSPTHSNYYGIYDKRSGKRMGSDYLSVESCLKDLTQYP